MSATGSVLHRVKLDRAHGDPTHPGHEASGAQPQSDVRSLHISTGGRKLEMTSKAADTALWDVHFKLTVHFNLTVGRCSLVTPTHVVHIPSLLYVRPAREVVCRVGLEQYALSVTGTLWARDWRRGGSIIRPRSSGSEKSFVIKAKGDWHRRGNSVEDPGQFLDVLERLCPGITKAAMGEQEDAEIRSEVESEADVK